MECYKLLQWVQAEPSHEVVSGAFWVKNCTCLDSFVEEWRVCNCVKSSWCRVVWGKTVCGGASAMVFSCGKDCPMASTDSAPITTLTLLRFSVLTCVMWVFISYYVVFGSLCVFVCLLQLLSWTNYNRSCLIAHRSCLMAYRSCLVILGQIGPASRLPEQNYWNQKYTLWMRISQLMSIQSCLWSLWNADKGRWKMTRKEIDDRFMKSSRKPLWLDLQPVDIKSRWRHNWKSAQVVNSHLVCDPTIRQPGFDLPR